MMLLQRNSEEYALALRALGAIFGARLRSRFTAVESMRAWSAPRARWKYSKQDILRAFHRASARLSGTCLVRSLALQRLFSENGHPTKLHIGVARSADGAFRAHAWLSDASGIILGGEEAGDYSLLSTWEAVGEGGVAGRDR